MGFRVKEVTYRSDSNAMTVVDNSSSQSGSLEDQPLADLLTSLWGQRFTGAVRVGGGTVWMANGEVYFAESSQPTPLTHILYDADVGPLPQIEEHVSRCEADGIGIAEAILEAAPESKDKLGRVLEEYTLSALFELSLPSSEQYVTESGAMHPIGSNLVGRTGETLVDLGERLALWQRIAAAVPSVDLRFNLSPALPDGKLQHTFEPSEWRYMSLLNGNHSVAEVVTNTQESALKVCATLYRLMLEGIVEPQTAN